VRSRQPRDLIRGQFILDTSYRRTRRTIAGARPAARSDPVWSGTEGVATFFSSEPRSKLRSKPGADSGARPRAAVRVRAGPAGHARGQGARGGGGGRGGGRDLRGADAQVGVARHPCRATRAPCRATDSRVLSRKATHASLGAVRRRRVRELSHGRALRVLPKGRGPLRERGAASGAGARWTGGPRCASGAAARRARRSTWG
jgi:hypothetical protein